MRVKIFLMKLIKIALGILFLTATPLVASASVNIIDNETGGDCATIASWDNTTKTCTLTADGTETINIKSDNIILNGGGFKITGTYTRGVNGVNLYANSVTVRNLAVDKFYYGIVLNAVSKSLLENNSISNTNEAICFYDSSDNKILSNTFLNNLQTVVFFNSHNNLLGNNGINLNVASKIRYQAIVFFYSDSNTLDGNNITLKDEVNPNLHQGVVFFDSHSNILKNNILSDTFQEIVFFDSNDNTITKNNLSGSMQALSLFASNNNKIYNNNFANNTIHAVDSKGVGNVFNLPTPGGGNYWDNFDNPAEGCLDDNNDNICDLPYIFAPKYYLKITDNYPWKIPNGWAVPPTPKYSSVAFLPGLEASRLYKQGIFFENKLWEPNWNNDVKKLYLDENGNSKNSSIYTRDIIGEAFGFNVYLKFMETMDGLVASSTIKEWEAFPYDWRFDQIDVANCMISEIEELAKNSDTGKVTIIAHSNGGLVGKALIDKLSAQGKENIIDKFIMVAVPQLGTPEAINGLLHGGQRGVLKGWLPSFEVTRELGENMQSAYGLLPSPSYFTAVDANSQPVIEFSSNTPATDYLRGVYGNAITSFSSLKKFLIGENGGRTEPAPQNVDEPNVLDAKFLNRAEADHTLLDNWLPPAGVEVIQIAGWGLDTLRGIRYEEKQNILCDDASGVCRKVAALDPQPIFTEDGDKTVVIPSATFLSGQKFYVDLPKHNDENLWGRRNRDHADILEIDGIQKLIEKIILDDTSGLPDNITLEKPSKDESKKLRISVHSPVSLDLYDAEGNHTGLTPNPNADSDIRLVEENIPNSYYLEMGEGKYVGSDTSTTNHIKLTGQALGTFTLKIDEVAGDAVTGSLEFKDVPVMANSIITIDAQKVANASPLKIDIDGNGTNDFSFAELSDSVVYFEVFAGIVQNINIASPYKEELIKDIEKIQKFIGKKEQKNSAELINSFDNLQKDIQKFVKKNIMARESGQPLLQIVSIIKDNVLK